jgi:hypothetical protein
MVGGLLLAASVSAASAAAASPATVGRIVAQSGAVTIERAAGPKVAAQRGDFVAQGDVVATGAQGSVRLLMRDKSVLALTANSRLRFTAYEVRPEQKSRRARLTVLAGRLWAMVTEAVHPEASYEVESGNAVAGVRGTELVFDVDPTGSSSVVVLHGEVELGSASARELLAQSERGSVDAGGIVRGVASATTVAELRGAARPVQALDPATVEKRLRVLRGKASGQEAAPVGPEEGEKGGERDDPGTGTSTFEDAGASVAETGGTRDGTPGLDYFDPSTMAIVHLSVQVRP